MLELRPNCEFCDKDLPPTSGEARICSYECTYCAECVEIVLQNVCPTCGGGFEPRPIRPQQAYRKTKELGLKHHPAVAKRTHSTYSKEEIASFVEAIKDIAPNKR
jgi:hypothetical protein